MFESSTAANSKVEDFETCRQKIREESAEKRPALKEQQKRRYDKNRDDASFEIGDQVFIYFEPRSKFQLPAKLQPKFRRGTVVTRDSPVTYTVEVQNPKGGTSLRRVHVEYMKSAVERPEELL